MKKILILLVLVSVWSFSTLFAQVMPQYWDDVQTIRQYDKIYAPPKNPILFVGSSSIRLWNDMERIFADYEVLNRGVGGTVINEIAFYINDLIIPYNPRQIILYVCANDLRDDRTTSDTVLNRTKRLLTLIRGKLPHVPIDYISMKPSPSRAKYLDKMILANRLIRDYIATQNEMHFIDIYNLMLTPTGKPRPELFRADSLHMNKLGYDLWTKEIKPFLLKK